MRPSELDTDSVKWCISLSIVFYRTYVYTFSGNPVQNTVYRDNAE